MLVAPDTSSKPRVEKCCLEQSIQSRLKPECLAQSLCIPTSSFQCICITEDKGQHNRPISKYPTLRTRIELDWFALHV